MSHSNAYDDSEAGRLPRNQPGSDSAPGFAPRTDPASSNALREFQVVTEREERATAAHYEAWHAFDESQRWLVERILTLVGTKATLRALTTGTCHAESAERLCAELDVVEQLIDHLRDQVDQARIGAAREAQRAVYREGCIDVP